MCEYIKNKKFSEILDTITTNNLPQNNTKPNII